MVRAVVAEVEPQARCFLRGLLSRTGQVEVVGESQDAGEALRLCAWPGVSAAFVAIRPPGLDGMALAARLSRLPEPPLVVMVADSPDHAAAAFRLHAADYLLEPLDAGQVADTVRHLAQRVRERRAASRSALEPVEDRLLVRNRCRQSAQLLSRHQVVAVLRRGRRTWIHTAIGEYPSYYTVGHVEAWLGGEPFLRVSREAIVNMEAVTEIRHCGDRLYRLHLNDRHGTTVEVSRSGARSLASLLRSRR